MRTAQNKGQIHTAFCTHVTMRSTFAVVPDQRCGQDSKATKHRRLAPLKNLGCEVATLTHGYSASTLEAASIERGYNA